MADADNRRQLNVPSARIQTSSTELRVVRDAIILHKTASKPEGGATETRANRKFRRNASFAWATVWRMYVKSVWHLELLLL